MKKLSRGAYEDTKGFLRVAETLLEVAILTVIYYSVWKNGYDLFAFAYMGKYGLMGLYGVMLYVFFQYSDCTMFGQLNRVDLIIGQVIALFIVNFLTYFQLCLIEEKLHQSRYIPFGIPIVLSFLCELEYEIKNIRIILAAKAAGLSPEEITRRVRGSYV